MLRKRYSLRAWLFRSRRRESRKSLLSQRRPCVETLEDRFALSGTDPFAPVLGELTDPNPDEGSNFSLRGTFTDRPIATGIGHDPMSYASLGDFHPMADVTVDTTTLSMSGGATFTGVVSSDGVAVFTFDHIVLEAGRTITATGSLPFALLSRNEISIAGTINASASGFTPGPGGGAGASSSFKNGFPAAGAPTSSRGVSGSGESGGGTAAGGSGGGFGGAGGCLAGQPCNLTGYRGGLAYGDLATSLTGGSGGGSTIVDVGGGGRGGGGGGAVELGAVGQLSMTGAVLASGTDGTLSFAAFPFTYGGGGGAGGGILLHGFDVIVTGPLDASGGDGGGWPDGASRFGGGGGGGRILIAHDPSSVPPPVLPGQAVVLGGSSGTNGGSGAEGTFEVRPVTQTPTAETYQYAINWGDGSGVVSGSATVDTPATPSEPAEGHMDVSHMYVDNGSFLITVVLTDSSGRSDTKMLTITVDNVPPELDPIQLPTTVVPGQPVDLYADFSDAGTADTHTAAIDWGDGTGVAAGSVTEVNAQGIAAGKHIFPTTGSRTVTVTLTDKDGATVSRTVSVSVVPMATEPDPTGSGLALFVGGTSANDQITIEGQNESLLLRAKIKNASGEEQQFFTGPFTHVIVYGNGGNDKIEVKDNVTVPAWLFGGDGDDEIHVGNAPTVLVGGAGDDHLHGGKFRDVIFGGLGRDDLRGEGGEDILIAGVTDGEEDLEMIGGIEVLWNSSRAYVDRILDLSAWLNDQTVHDDGVEDEINGGGGLDWYLANTTQFDPKKRDRISKIAGGEQVTQIQ